MRTLDEIKKTATGAAIIKDWLGDGSIVTKTVAEERAAICVGCPENLEAGWWGRVKNAIAEAMVDHLAVKNNAGMVVSVEDQLGVCNVCGCCNPLQVWTPAVHLKKHTSAEMFSKFPEFCWKKHL